MTTRQQRTHAAFGMNDGIYFNKFAELAKARNSTKADLLRSLIDVAYHKEIWVHPVFSDTKWRCIWDKDGIYKQPKNARRWFGGEFELNLEAGVFPLGSIWESEGRPWAVCGNGLLWPNEHKLESGEIDYPEDYPPQHLKPLNGRVRSEVRWRIDEIR